MRRRVSESQDIGYNLFDARTSMAHHIGLISDTHGLLRPSVHDALAGVDHVVGEPGRAARDIILTQAAMAAAAEREAEQAQAEAG